MEERTLLFVDEAGFSLLPMAANVWREENEWPLARTIETRYYLHSGGRANTLHGDGTLNTIPPSEEVADRYDYDPAHPVITHGGALLMTADYPAGPYDQRSTENREDVLVYTTTPSGPIRGEHAAIVLHERSFPPCPRVHPCPPWWTPMPGSLMSTGTAFSAASKLMDA